MPRLSMQNLSRRERQIMDIIYRRQEASAAEVQAEIADPPSYSAIRALLRILEEKGHLRHKQIKAKYVFVPTRLREHAGKSALLRVLKTFFEGSTEKAVAALLDTREAKVSNEELDRLSKLIENAKKGV